MILNAAPLIHSRTKFVDYRTRFLARPNDFDSAFTKSIKKYILSSTSSIEELGRDECRRIVISKRNNVIFGLTASMAYFNQISEGMLDDMLCDQYGRRNIFLFVGLVVKKNNVRRNVNFPSENIFVEVIQRYLAPRWNDYPHAEASLEATLAEYEIAVEFGNIASVDTQLSVNSRSQDIVKLFSSQNNTAVLNCVLGELPSGGDISVCTNMSYVSEARGSAFMNVTIKGLSQERMEKNCLFKEAAATSQADDMKPQEDGEKKKESKPMNARDIALNLLCIGAIVICGTYIIVVDKKTVLNILIPTGVSLTALIEEIILISSRMAREDNACKSKEEEACNKLRDEKIKSDFIIDIKSTNNSGRKNENTDDIFKF